MRKYCCCVDPSAIFFMIKDGYPLTEEPPLRTADVAVTETGAYAVAWNLLDIQDASESIAA